MQSLYIFTFLASLIAVCGYMVNSRDILIGSMLISPLLNPVFSFHKSNSSDTLAKNLLKYNGETLSLIIISFITGYIATKIIKINKETEIMQSTVDWDETYLKSGVNYIIPLLAGIILSLAKDNNNIVAITGVGVTISVLPPLVNSGMLKGLGKDKKSWASFKLAILNLIITSVSYIATNYFSR